MCSRPSSRRVRRARRAAAIAITGAAVFAVTGCSSPPDTLERYCTELAASRDLLNVDLVDPLEIDALVERYERFAAIAPLAVEQQWGQMRDLVVAARDVDLGDAAAVEEVVERAASTERSVAQLAVHARDRCGIELAVGLPPPATTTTVVPAESAAPTSGG